VILLCGNWVLEKKKKLGFGERFEFDFGFVIEKGVGRLN
jgi:hypothetical protein